MLEVPRVWGHVGGLLVRPVHPVCDIFPMFAEADLMALAADIEAHGLLEPIVTFRGQLIDGRNRLAACELIGMEPDEREWEGDEGDLIPWVVSRNLHRRHLTDGQRKMVAARLTNLQHGSNQHRERTNAVNLDEDPQICGSSTRQEVTQGDAAALLNVPERGVQQAAALLRDGAPEVVRQVESGEVSLGAALDLTRAVPSKADQAAIARDFGPEGVQVFAADARKAKAPPPLPPWEPRAPSPPPPTLVTPAPTLITDLDVIAASLAALAANPAALEHALAGLPKKALRKAGRAERKKNDAYYTPQPLADLLVRDLDGPDNRLLGLKVLEPSAGAGAFALACEIAGATVTVLDLDPDAPCFKCDAEWADRICADFLEWSPPDGETFDLIVGNPPYLDGEAFVVRTLELLAPGGLCVFLLRLGFWAGLERCDGLYQDHPVEDVRPVAPRPSFTGDGKTDGTEYGVFYFRRPGGVSALPVPEVLGRHVRWFPVSGLEAAADDDEAEAA